jgi:flagellar protein FliJ
VKRFEFSLDRMLKVKRQLERLAELEQARAAKVVAEARGTVDGLKSRLLQVSSSVHSAVGQGVSPGQWVNAYAMSEHLGQQIELAEQAAKAAEAKLAAAARNRTAVSQEVESLSSLRRQQWEKWQQEAAAKVQEQLDEVTLRRWMAAQTSTAGAA